MVDDDAAREALIATAASELARLVTWTRAERTVRGDDDEHAAWLDEMIAGLEPVAAEVGDVKTSTAIRRVIQRHGGGGPWEVDDLAAMTGCDVESVRRVVAALTDAGLAGLLDPPPPAGEDPAPAVE